MVYMRLAVERIEDGIAVCEVLNGGEAEEGGAAENHGGPVSRRKFKASELPEGAKEGDVLIYSGNKFTPDPEAARERREHIRKLMDSVFG